MSLLPFLQARLASVLRPLDHGCSTIYMAYIHALAPFFLFVEQFLLRFGELLFVQRAVVAGAAKAANWFVQLAG